MIDIGRLLDADAPPFALLFRPESTGSPVVEVFTGEMVAVACLADLPAVADAASPVLAVLPYRQLAERGFCVRDDGAPLLAMRVDARAAMPLDAALSALPEAPVTSSGAVFDLDDAAYADLARVVISEAIGRGEGANFVLKRTLRASIDGFGPLVACALFKRLLRQESGAYWTFVVSTGAATFIGASPERHVTLGGGRVAMTPISGTYRYPAAGAETGGLLEFLADRKESDELYMVLDEELKMMGSVCEQGGRVTGPYLREMAHLAHTEYLIDGCTSLDPREILRQTMFAPTVIGSPLENACRAIARHEPSGRGYYSGVVALIGRDEQGRDTLDSAIMIRTAAVDAAGVLSVGVGATIVRHSDPDAEAAETKVKAAGWLRALGIEPAGAIRQATRLADPAAQPLAGHPEVLRALRQRNDLLAPFWLTSRPPAAAALAARGSRVLMIDAEDTFTTMLAQYLRALGQDVTTCGFAEPFEPDGFDLVVVGPGPGDPRDTAHPKIAVLHERLRWLLAHERPVLAVCLGHQVLSAVLGLPIRRLPTPRQGAQHEIELFGATVLVGFYSTFAVTSAEDVFWPSAFPGPVHVARDPGTDEVFALRGPTFRSYQFHPESILSREGLAILAEALADLLPSPVRTDA